MSNIGLTFLTDFLRSTSRQENTVIGQANNFADAINSVLMGPSNSTLRPPNSFQYTTTGMGGRTSLTFDKNTNQMTYIAWNGAGELVTSRTVNIPPERWAPFLQAFDAAGGINLNGKSFVKPGIADGTAYTLEMTDRDNKPFSVSGRGKNPTGLDIRKMLRNLTGLAL